MKLARAWSWQQKFASLFEPGRNCYRTACTRDSALLVDDAYFFSRAHAALRATHSVVYQPAWDFCASQNNLHLNEAQASPSCWATS